MKKLLKKSLKKSQSKKKSLKIVKRKKTSNAGLFLSHILLPAEVDGDDAADGSHDSSKEYVV